YLFSLSAGLGVSHHTLTVFGFPDYALFILAAWWQQSEIRHPKSKIAHLARRQLPTLLPMLAFALLGLSVWLYFPLRSPNAPLGATGLRSLDGFLTHVLARGLADTLPYYGLADVPNRLRVFWSILRLQYGLVPLFLALLGFSLPLFIHARAKNGKGLMVNSQFSINNSPLTIHHLPLTIYILTFFSFFSFVIMLRVQDIMAYLLGPLLLIGLLAGLGLAQLLALLQARLRPDGRSLSLLLAALFLLGPVLQTVRNAPRISLRGVNEGAAYVDAVFDWFAGRGAGATLLNDWEHQTPLWYAEFVEGRQLDPADAAVRWVGAGLATPWLTAVFEHLPAGPVFLSSYRREIVDAGFRLRARGPFYQVVEPGAADLPPELTPTTAGDADGGIDIVGVGLPQTTVRAGDVVPLTLAMRAPAGTADFVVPVIRVGDANSPRQLDMPFTTDSHLVTPAWLPGEVIVERFNFALPHDLPAGDYPVTIDLQNLSADAALPLGLPAGTLAVTAQRHPIRTADLLATFRQQVGLVRATAGGAGNGRVAAPWPAPLTAAPGDTLQLTLTWRSLAPADESYTVFVHLIDLANRPIVALDYTPLGGSMPTHLWFPKWLPGQQMQDPYRLTIPADLPPGEYLIEIGLYEMVGQRRLHIADAAGNLVGDRYILGGVVVQPGD
ncbi:MAG: hypothetical protein KC425_04435, partial [Anaerolineales bacterium]|nr:hypothetical protein [Anaerolineales bacterium]